MLEAAYGVGSAISIPHLRMPTVNDITVEFWDQHGLEKSLVPDQQISTQGCKKRIRRSGHTLARAVITSGSGRSDVRTTTISLIEAAAGALRAFYHPVAGLPGIG
jgi:hypothetical protein